MTDPYIEMMGNRIDYEKWQTPDASGRYVLPNGLTLSYAPTRGLIETVLTYQYYRQYSSPDADGWFTLPDGSKQRNMPTRAQIRAADPQFQSHDKGLSDWAVQLVGKAFDGMREHNKKVQQFVDDILTGKITDREADEILRKGL